MKLYEVREDLKLLMEMDDELESLDDSLKDTIDSLSLDFDQKVKNVIYVIKNLQAFEAANKSEKERFASRQKKASNRINSLKQYIKESMELVSKNKIDYDEFNIRIQKNPPSAEIEETLIPEEYLQIVKVVDKKSILIDLKGGQLIPGAKLVSDKTHLRIR